jgi:predicted P-loop ATPase
MMVRSVACALDLNVFNKQVFILVHSMQNSGKSTFCRFLCPPQLSDYFTENISTDKDSLIALANNFIVNMDELATLNRAEINTLKSMISRNNVNVRLPYGRRQINLPRRANFVGSTNKDEFLTDETGSVRWLCFELVDRIDFSYKEKVNINLVWKQAYQLYKNGYEYELTQEEIDYNHQRNKKYESTMLEYDIIPDFCMPCEEKLKSNFKTAGQILVDLKYQDKLRSVNISKPNISKALKMLGYKNESCYLEEYKQSRKGYFIRYVNLSN